MSVRASGLYATYRGVEYEVSGQGESYVLLRMANGEDEGTVEMPDALDRGEADHWRWVKVPKAALDRLVDLGTTATWRGGTVSIMEVGDDMAVVYVDSPSFAKANGLVGDQYMGFWAGRAPIHELSDVHETVRELPIVREGR